MALEWSFSDEVVLEDYESNLNKICKLSDTRYIIAFRDRGIYDYGVLVPFDVDLETEEITIGDPFIFSYDIVEMIEIISLSENDYILVHNKRNLEDRIDVLYLRSNSSSVSSVNDMLIGIIDERSTSTYPNNLERVDITKMTSTAAILVYCDSTTNSDARVVSISGDVMSIGPEYAITTTNNYTDITVQRITDQYAGVLYHDIDDNRMETILIWRNGNYIWRSDRNDIGTTNVGDYVNLIRLSDDRMVGIYKDEITGSSKAVLLEVNYNSYELDDIGAPFDFNNGESINIISATSMGDNKIGVTYLDQDGTSKIQIIEVNNDTFTNSIEGTFKDQSVSSTDILYTNPVIDKLVITFNSDYDGESKSVVMLAGLLDIAFINYPINIELGLAVDNDDCKKSSLISLSETINNGIGLFKSIPRTIINSFNISNLFRKSANKNTSSSINSDLDNYNNIGKNTVNSIDSNNNIKKDFTKGLAYNIYVLKNKSAEITKSFVTKIINSTMISRSIKKVIVNSINFFGNTINNIDKDIEYKINLEDLINKNSNKNTSFELSSTMNIIKNTAKIFTSRVVNLISIRKDTNKSISTDLYVNYLLLKSIGKMFINNFFIKTNKITDISFNILYEVYHNVYNKLTKYIDKFISTGTRFSLGVSKLIKKYFKYRNIIRTSQNTHVTKGLGYGVKIIFFDSIFVLKGLVERINISDNINKLTNKGFNTFNNVYSNIKRWISKQIESTLNIFTNKTANINKSIIDNISNSIDMGNIEISKLASKSITQNTEIKDKKIKKIIDKVIKLKSGVRRMILKGMSVIFEDFTGAWSSMIADVNKYFEKRTFMWGVDFLVGRYLEFTTSIVSSISMLPKQILKLINKEISIKKDNLHKYINKIIDTKILILYSFIKKIVFSILNSFSTVFSNVIKTTDKQIKDQLIVDNEIIKDTNKDVRLDTNTYNSIYKYINKSILSVIDALNILKKDIFKTIQETMHSEINIKKHIDKGTSYFINASSDFKKLISKGLISISEFLTTLRFDIAKYIKEEFAAGKSLIKDVFKNVLSNTNINKEIIKDIDKSLEEEINISNSIIKNIGKYINSKINKTSSIIKGIFKNTKSNITVDSFLIKYIKKILFININAKSNVVKEAGKYIEDSIVAKSENVNNIGKFISSIISAKLLLVKYVYKILDSLSEINLSIKLAISKYLKSNYVYSSSLIKNTFKSVNYNMSYYFILTKDIYKNISAKVLTNSNMFKFIDKYLKPHNTIKTNIVKNTLKPIDTGLYIIDMLIKGTSKIIRSIIDLGIGIRKQVFKNNYK
jgi:hypothetical protein